MHLSVRHWMLVTLCFTLGAAPAWAQSAAPGGIADVAGRYTVRVDDNLAILLDTATGRSWALAPNRVEWQPLSGGPPMPATQPDGFGAAAPGDRWERVSPFTKVEIHDQDRVLVVFDGELYQLLGMEGLATPEILAYVRQAYGNGWEKRFVEDIVEVLAAMGKRAEGTVSLRLQDLDTGNVHELAKAPLKRARRAAVVSPLFPLVGLGQ